MRNIVVVQERKYLFLILLIVCLILTQRTYSQHSAVSVPENVGEINIGFLITEDPSNNSLMREVVDVVNLRVNHVNESGGVQGRKINLVVKSVDGLWGAGSKQAVNLITEHKSSAIIGFVDSRSAHLIEQVCAKAQVPFISVYSTDPSLSRINIPWFFSMMPDAEQQAKFLVSYINQKSSNMDVALVSSNNYEMEFIRRSFIRQVESQNSKIRVKEWKIAKDNFDQVSLEIFHSNAESIVFFGSSEELQKLHRELTLNNVPVPIYTSMNAIKGEYFQNADHRIFTVGPDTYQEGERKILSDNFMKEYAYKPGNYATYADDSINVLLAAIDGTKTNRQQIQKSLREIKYEGINGVISFDTNGMINQRLTMLKLDNQVSQ